MWVGKQLPGTKPLRFTLLKQLASSNKCSVKPSLAEITFLWKPCTISTTNTNSTTNTMYITIQGGIPTTTKPMTNTKNKNKHYC